jgi:lysophospholipase L1-like esterase
MVSRLASFLVVASLLAACGDDKTPTTPTRPDPIPVAPSITCPANVSANTTALNAEVTYPAPSVSGGTAPVTATCTPPSGSTFPLGATAVACTATDAASRQATCSFSVIVNRIPTIVRTSFLAFGDSVTAGEITVPTTTALDEQGFPSFKLVIVPSASYPAQLQTLLRGRYLAQAPQIVVVNSGTPGEFAADSIRRFSTVYTQTRPEVVLLLDGYNDLNATGTSAIASASAAVETMARQARFGGSRVFIANLTPPRAGGRNTIPVATITAYNERMRLIAISEGATFVDLYSALLGNVTLYVGVDGLHLTEAGYQRVAETFFNAIQLTLEVR